ncbi:MAG: MATE family efflux transporter [Clostridia bacterium]|nr:MATE family efflux transporter [Clostridia bacterium]
MSIFRDKEFIKKVVMLSIPIALQNLITSILNIFDQVMVGWLPKEIADNALSAVLLANQIVFIFQIILFASSNTVNIFVAQYTHSGRQKDIPKRIGFLLIFNLFIAVVVMLVCRFFPNIVIGIFSPSAEYKHMAEEFLSVVCFSFLPMSISVTFSFTMRAIKRMRVALMANVIAVVLNMLFNYWFMFGGFGVKPQGLIGAAYGTILSRIIEMLIIVGGLIVCKYPLVAKPKTMFGFGDGYFRIFIKMFVPILCNELFWVLSTTLYLTVYDKLPNSAVVLAAVNIANSVNNIISVAMIGVGSASGIIIGNILGDGDEQKAREYAKKSLIFSFWLGIGIGAVIVVSAFFAPSFFKNVSGEAQETARNLLFMFGATAVLRSLTFMLIIGILRSGGDTTFCMLIETAAIWLVSVPLVVVGGLVFKWNIYILYMLTNVSEVVKIVFCVVRAKGDKWLKLKTVKPRAEKPAEAD